MFTDHDVADHPASTDAVDQDHFGATEESHGELTEHPEQYHYQDEHGDHAGTADGSLDITTTVDVGDDASGHDLVLTGPGGHQVDVGAPNVSAEGNGELDAVAIQTQDGSVEIYVDADHNGTVDEAIRIDQNGHFAVWTSDGHGGWEVSATGHIDAQGHAQLDRTVDQQAATIEPSALEAAQASAAPGSDHGTGSGHTTEVTQSSGGESYPGVAAGDLAVASGDHYIDAGPAKYDMDGDGHAETAVVESDGRIIQVSDTDGDGRADEMLQVDTHTHQAAILIDDGSGDWQVAATGHVDASGDFVEDGAAGSHSTEQSGTEHGSAPDIVYTSASGGHTDLGAPNQDLDGDGRDESVAVKTSDGNVLIVSDTNADGSPDQIILIDGQSGEVSWAVPDGHGGWEVVQTGHIQSDGSLVIDSSESGHAATSHSAASHGTTESQGSTHQGPENVSVAVDGRSFDAGRATIDSDGDGVPDTVAVPGPGGTTLYYEDSDGDGVADKAWTTDQSGAVTATYHLNASGSWAPAETSANR